mmetsp:Transcript_13810/g.17118  ORF Transcript_13810/g.17118 Transcript_13810/m.17118 type:complete len:81 (-) Transcript_13810:152-394(-)
MPPALSKFVNLGIAIAPKKLRSRISLGYNLDNFKELDLSQVPLHYGGSFEMHTQEWINMRTREHESAKLHIEKDFHRRVK